MVDRDIRGALRKRLDEAHRDDSATLLLDELGVCEGRARVDMAVVNGTLAGFEIKSDEDTLVRLPRQVEAYERVFDFTTLVVGTKHADRAVDLLPSTWGVLCAVEDEREVALEPRRSAERNNNVDPFCVAQLLWRDEALALLERHGLERGLRSKPRHVLWRALADQLSQDDLASAVRDQLRSRVGWRSG